ncbi:MAG: hypothetical protein ACK4MX_11160 [Thermaurantiacus sp.]
MVGLVLAHFSHQPLRQFQLHHGWHQPVGLFGQMFNQLIPGRGSDQPFDPRRGIDEDHQARSARSR